MSSIEWQDWNDETFDRALKEDKPVLLTIFASWCRWCRTMDQESFSNSEVIALVNKHYIPIRVDKDRRPDVNSRYNMGGWPSVSFLTPEGNVITGGTFFETQKLSILLEKIAQSYINDKNRIEETIRNMIEKESASQGNQLPDERPLSLDIIKNVSRSIYSEFDEKYGGFGTGQKFPHSEALSFTILQHFKTNDIKLYGVTTKTLNGMAESKLFDSVGGGFFRFCATRDWRSPHTEKLLETNVRLLDNYLDAYVVMNRSTYREIAQQTVSYICTHLWDGTNHAFWGSQDADDDYYQMETVDRRDRKPPQVDRTIYTNLNALAASVFFKAGAILDDPLLQQMATSALDFVLEKMYSRNKGVYHYFDTSRHIMGILNDQIFLCHALMRAVEYMGDNKYLDVIHDLIETIIQKQASEEGGFYDITRQRSAHGSLTRQNKSIMENAVMASVLIKYYYLTFDERYLELAEKTLQAFARDYHLYGYFTAGYAEVVDLFFYKPLYVIILGNKEDKVTARLRKAATEIYLPSRIVQTIDPETEPELVERMKFPIGKEPKAYVCLEQSCHAAVDDPDELKNVMTVIDSNRAPGQQPSVNGFKST